jgi:hypothetical protein
MWSYICKTTGHPPCYHESVLAQRLHFASASTEKPRQALGWLTSFLWFPLPPSITHHSSYSTCDSSTSTSLKTIQWWKLRHLLTFQSSRREWSNEPVPVTNQWTCDDTTSVNTTNYAEDIIDTRWYQKIDNGNDSKSALMSTYHHPQQSLLTNNHPTKQPNDNITIDWMGLVD